MAGSRWVFACVGTNEGSNQQALMRAGIRMRWHNSRTEAGTNEGGNQHALSMHSPKPSAPRGAPW